MDNRELVQSALEIMRQAYAPYSRFTVGAALLCEDGTVYRGVNVENASYGATICAERSAVSAAVTGGNRNFSKIAVVASGDGYCMPCGICRQVLHEFAPDIRLLCADKNGSYKEFGLKDLLPHAF